MYYLYSILCEYSIFCLILKCSQCNGIYIIIGSHLMIIYFLHNKLNLIHLGIAQSFHPMI